MSSSEAYNSQNEIAIIGLAGRFPGAKNIEEFWQNLQAGKESISFFTDEELAGEGIDPAVLENPNYVKAKAVLEDIELFDASFFGINPREAEITDPQHRLFLECAWTALEDAGYDSETYKGRIGVYAGVGLSTYLLFNLYPNHELIKSVDVFQISIGNDKDFLPTQVSYKLNLKGPSVNVQTACSTSLVAVHLACQSLLNGESDIALAGGVTIGVPHLAGYLYQEGRILSPDGHCRAFDAKAQGTVPGAGVGVVVLKRLEDAIADGDCIHAVIKSSAINNDGSLKIGYTAPSQDGQAEVIAEALALARVKPETVSYIETHGTGTVLGDPIEIAALKKVFHTQKKGFCAIGSVKTNIGHLDTAAGVAGLIKTVLALKHKQIPPSLHFQQPNPKIDFDSSPFYVNSKLSKWETNGTPRRAGVSSFGIGGTNAHVILEEAPAVREREEGEGRKYQLLVLSAKTDKALSSATTNLVDYLKQHSEVSLADVAYTLQVGRRAFDRRRIVVAQDLDDAVTTLSSLDAQRVFSYCSEPLSRSIAFMFPGQGAQYANMALELYQTEPIFQQQIDRCCQLLKPQLGFDLRDVIYPKAEKAETAAQKLNQTYIAQPALFVIEYALAQLWMSWGVRPEATIGHSIGEYVAACLAGVFSLEEALALVAARGRMMQQLPSGTMLAVGLPTKEVIPLLDKRLSVAASNAPSLCVVSGATDVIAALQNQLASQGVDCRRLHTSHAFHSQMMEPMQEAFASLVKKVDLQPPKIPFISNVTGTWITAQEAKDPNYWVRHLRQTVLFSEGLAELLKQPNQILLEVGPGRTLSTLAKQHQAENLEVLTSVRHPQEQQSDAAFLLNSLGRLWLAGVQINWSGFYALEQRRRVPLPTYPFKRQRYWIEPPAKIGDLGLRQIKQGKKSNIADWFYIPVWKQSTLLEKGDLAKQQKCWLVFVDECGVGSQIVQQLQKEGQDAYAVIAGDQFTKLGDRKYCINPQQSDDYDTLLQALLAENKSNYAIAHLWGVTANNQTYEAIECFETNQDLGFYSLLFLAQALGKQGITDAVQISVVTNNLHDVVGTEILNPEKTTVLGPCKVIPQEYPNITCRSIDVVITQMGTYLEEKLIDQLLTEITSDSSDLVVAYRGHHRWVQIFEAVRLEPAIKGRMRLREKGIYLITGGLGGMGLELAEHLAQTVQAKLILIGRSSLPQKDDWEKWLATHDDRDDTSHKIRKLQNIEQLGAEMLVVSANVSDRTQMQAAVDLALERFGEIHGVIHAAGIAGGGIIQLKTPQIANNVLAPKVKGTLVLDAIFKDINLDFLVLCSSLSAILGGFGQVDYCAANAFLDGFVHSKNSGVKPFTVSINWCTWQEVGMAVNTAIPEELKQRRQEFLKQGILPKEGADAFDRILYSGLSQVVVSTQDLQAQIERNYSQFLEEELAPLEKQFAAASLSKPTHPRPKLANDYVAPRNEVEQNIADIWQQLLGIDMVGIYDNFFELGGHSLLATQVISRLRKAFPVEIPLRSLLVEGSTIADLAKVIETMVRQKLDELSEEEIQLLLANG